MKKQRKAKNQAGRAGLGLTAFAGLVFLFMALPWLTLSCSGRELLTQHGFQAMVGRVDSHLDSLGQQQKTARQFTEKQTQKGSAAWWLALVLLGSSGAGFAGVRLFSGDRRAAKPAIAMSAIAALVLSTTLLFGLPLERAVQQTKRELQSSDATTAEQRPSAGIAASVGKALVVERKPALWLTLAAVWSQLLLGGAIHLAQRRER